MVVVVFCERLLDVVVMDVCMLVMDGIEVIWCLVGGLCVFVFMIFDFDEYVYEVLGAGVSGFLFKDVIVEWFFDVVCVVVVGDVLLVLFVMCWFVFEFVCLCFCCLFVFGELILCEIEVLWLLVEGLLNVEIVG